ncbi:AP endonuclease [Scheffersomyces coipomensis]|uniref:AP endonuclease n=1 Tax=Scheffersomyces coipomensis TaxID=1788519 RepID=UPI00315CC5D0
MDLTKLANEDPLNQIESKNLGNSTIRYVTFNVNGIKTLCNYHPWNKIDQDYDAMFTLLKADIITLQELKLSPSNISTIKNIGHLPHYKSFITLPKLKRGYSGVGVFIRIPSQDEPLHVKRALTVVKAEEGLSGYLSSSNGVKYRHLNEADHIGGYSDALDETLGLELDEQGRCVVIELANNTVIFSLYCPANSMGTEEGEIYRLKFLQTLLERCHNLKFKMGKEVVIMGDINVCLDLIDSAESISDRLKQNLIKSSLDGLKFEAMNYEECQMFKRNSTKARILLNKYTIPQLIFNYKDDIKPPPSNTNFLYDTTRYILGRKLNVYTVWNTMTNSRSINYGSRIDLILVSSYAMVKNISQADIWPFILGSDHCPIFTDFDVLEQEDNGETLPIVNKLNFEAKYYHKLSQMKDIASMFSRVKSQTSTSSVNSNTSTASSSSSTPDPELKRSSTSEIKKSSTIEYVSRKKPKKDDSAQKSIGNFFFSKSK